VRLSGLIENEEEFSVATSEARRLKIESEYNDMCGASQGSGQFEFPSKKGVLGPDSRIDRALVQRAALRIAAAYSDSSSKHIVMASTTVSLRWWRTLSSDDTRRPCTG